MPPLRRPTQTPPKPRRLRLQNLPLLRPKNLHQPRQPTQSLLCSRLANRPGVRRGK